MEIISGLLEKETKISGQKIIKNQKDYERPLLGGKNEPLRIWLTKQDLFRNFIAGIIIFQEKNNDAGNFMSMRVAPPLMAMLGGKPFPRRSHLYEITVSRDIEPESMAATFALASGGVHSESHVLAMRKFLKTKLPDMCQIIPSKPFLHWLKQHWTIPPAWSTVKIDEVTFKDNNFVPTGNSETWKSSPRGIRKISPTIRKHFIKPSGSTLEN